MALTRRQRRRAASEGNSSSFENSQTGTTTTQSGNLSDLFPDFAGQSDDEIRQNLNPRGSGFGSGQSGFTGTVSSNGQQTEVPLNALDQFSPEQLLVSFSEALGFANAQATQNVGTFLQNFGLAGNLALENQQTELQGLEAFVPRATELIRRADTEGNDLLLSESDRFDARNQGAARRATEGNVALRTNIFEGVSPGLRDRIATTSRRNQARLDNADEANVRAITRNDQLANGILPDELLNDQLSRTARNQAADGAAAGGFGINSAASRNFLDRVDLNTRLGIAEQGERNLGSAIDRARGIAATSQDIQSSETSQNISVFGTVEAPGIRDFAPIQATPRVTDVGGQIRPTPTVDAGSIQRSLNSELTPLTTITPTTILGQNLNTQAQNVNSRFRQVGIDQAFNNTIAGAFNENRNLEQSQINYQNQLDAAAAGLDARTDSQNQQATTQLITTGAGLIGTYLSTPGDNSDKIRAVVSDISERTGIPFDTIAQTIGQQLGVDLGFDADSATSNDGRRGGSATQIGTDDGTLSEQEDNDLTFESDLSFDPNTGSSGSSSGSSGLEFTPLQDPSSSGSSGTTSDTSRVSRFSDQGGGENVEPQTEGDIHAQNIGTFGANLITLTANWDDLNDDQKEQALADLYDASTYGDTNVGSYVEFVNGVTNYVENYEDMDQGERAEAELDIYASTTNNPYVSSAAQVVGIVNNWDDMTDAQRRAEIDKAAGDWVIFAATGVPGVASTFDAFMSSVFDINLASLYEDAYGSNKPRDQKIRDAMREHGTKNGVFILPDKQFAEANGVKEGSHQVQLADGSYYDIGVDGRNQLDNYGQNIDGKETRHTFDVDWSDPRIPELVAYTNPITSILYGEYAPKFVGHLTNAAISNNNTLSGSVGNLKHMVQNGGIDYQTGLIVLQQQKASGLLDPETADIYLSSWRDLWLGDVTEDIVI